jgi:flavin reductase (DIM6/NTAB) family NADH-FMN oxidoreductase RutF
MCGQSWNSLGERRKTGRSSLAARFRNWLVAPAENSIEVIQMNEVEEPTVPHPEALRKSFACFPSGVIALCGLDGARPVGMSVASFTSVSLDPPLVSVCIANSSSTWPILRALPRLGVSVLGQDHATTCRSLASKTAERFANVCWTQNDRRAVFIEGASLYLECTLEREVEAGDHMIALLRIGSVEAFPEVQPLVFHMSKFRELANA